MGDKQSKPLIDQPTLDLIDFDRSLGENVQHWIKPSTRLKRNMEKYPDSICELYLQRATQYLEEGQYELAFNDTCSYLIEKGPQTLRACCIRASALDKWGDYIGAINEWTRAYTFLVSGATIAHALEQKTFRSPTWCHVCHELLVGLKRQGFSCLHCELTVHQRCVSNDLLPCASADSKAENQHNFAIVRNSFAVSCEICQSSSLGMNNTNFAYCLKCEMKLHLSCWNEKKASIVSTCRRKKSNPAFMWKILFGLAVSLYHNFEYESALGHYNQAIEELHALSNALTSSSEQLKNNANASTSRMSGLFQSLTADLSKEIPNLSTSSAASTSPPTLLHSTRLSGLFNSNATDPSNETPTVSTSYFRSFSSKNNRNATNGDETSVSPTTATTTSTVTLTSSLGALRSSTSNLSTGICESLIPSLALVRANRGVLHLALKNYDECICDISFAFRHGVKSELFSRSRGNAYFELGLLEKARLDFIEMVTLDTTRSADYLPGRYLEVLSSSELSSAIFTFLPQAHQSKCRLVCKFWNVSILKLLNLSVAGQCQLQLKNYLRQFPEIQVIFSSFVLQYSGNGPKTTINLIYADGIQEAVEFSTSHTLVNIYQYAMFREMVVYAKDHITMWRKDGPRFVGEIVFTEKEVSFTPFGPFDLFIKGSHKPLPWLANTIESENLQDCTLFMRRKPPYELTKPLVVEYAPEISNLIPYFEFASTDIDMEAHRLSHLKTTAFLACIARNNWLARYQFSQGMLVSEVGDDFIELDDAVAMLDVAELERANKTNGNLFIPRASDLPHILTMVHLREKYLLLKSLLESFREEIAPSLSTERKPLQHIYLPFRNWIPTPGDVMQECFHFPKQDIPPSLSESSSGSSLEQKNNTISDADPNLAQPRPLPLLYFEANSQTKLLLLRYTAWMKALEVCHIPNAFLFDFFRQWQHPNDVYEHPILLYDLFAADM